MVVNRVAALALLATCLGACAADSGTNGAGGTVVGAAPAGSGTNRLGGTGIGAAVGGFIGSRMGAALDDEDRRRAYAAEIQALDTGPSGAPVAWRNPDSGRYGNVVPGPAYQANGAACRHFTHTAYIDGTPQIERGTACRNADGTWMKAN